MRTSANGSGMSVPVQRKSSSGRTMSGAALNGDMSQKYSLSQSDDEDDNTRADGDDDGRLICLPLKTIHSMCIGLVCLPTCLSVLVLQ